MSFFKNISLVGQIIIGLVIGTLTGLFLPQFEILNLFGSSFIEALKAVAPALVMVLVISALVNASNSEGKRFRKIIALYLFSTLTAAVVAVFISFL
ncbi:MAG: cation:dicarboxylase symporter family transporter, partial [Alphaproteobacteria bacterium]|nr:cation:dicarboxylase symporter family transporter [Alphaproteobacteria bacterium]